jgi:hypothetical protein
MARNENLLQASSVLAGQFWQTPPELKGASFAPDVLSLIGTAIAVPTQGIDIESITY